MIVTIVGGPEDGAHLELPDRRIDYIEVAELQTPSLLQLEKMKSDDIVPVRVYRVPVTLTKNGYQAIWAERK